MSFRAPRRNPLLKSLAVLSLSAAIACPAVVAANAAPAPGVASRVALFTEGVVEGAPVVQSNPEHFTADSGDGASFSAASEDPTASAQWQISTDGGDSFTDLEGETGSSLDLATVTYAQNGTRYRVTFTNESGSTPSDSALLTVNAALPEIQYGPDDTWVAAGKTFSFSVEATGDPAPTVQWQVRKGTNVSNLPGATKSEYSGTAPTSNNSGWQYRAVLTNVAGTTESEWATLTVEATAPVVKTSPKSVSVKAGVDAVFTAAATADPAATAQWEVKRRGTSYFEEIEGATRPTLRVVKPTLADSRNQYRVRFENDADDVVSAAATLTVTGKAPGKARKLKVKVAKGGKITITWKNPAKAGSSAVTSYLVGYGTSAWGNGAEVKPSVRKKTFKKLPKGKYTVTVTAVNAAGPGARTTVRIKIK